MEKEKSFNRKPMNLLLEIVFNKKNKKVKSVRTSNISNRASFNDSTDSVIHSLNKSQTKSNPDIRNNTEKRVQIKIKLDISDFSESDLNESFPNEKLENLNPNAEQDFEANNKNYEATIRKMASKVCLSINHDSNFEDETGYFDVHKTKSQETIESVTELYNEFDLNESHHQSIIWKKIFDQIQQKYNTSTQDNKIVNVIHELIMEKYKQALSIIKQRMEKREHRSISLDTGISNNSNNETSVFKKSFASYEDIKYPFNSGVSLDTMYLKKNEISSSDIFHPSSNSAMPKYLNSTFQSELRLSKSLDHILESDKYPKVTTVNEVPIEHAQQSGISDSAIQSEELDISIGETEYSIGSSNISLLISEADYARSRRNCNSYRRVGRFRNSNKQIEQQSSTSSSIHLYESLDDLLLNNNKKNNLVKKIALQNEIIQQSSKAARVCRARPELFGGETLIEAEKILLIAGIRKEAIEDELKKLDYEEVDTQLTSCTVKIHNVTLYDSGAFKNKANSTWYYVCIVHQGAAVYATKTTTQTENTISFPDEFIFENIPSDFQINLSIYALSLKSKKNKNFRHRSREELRRVPSSTESYFSLWGTSLIKPSQSHQAIYRLSKIPLEASIINSFTANVKTNFKIHVKQAGFLTLGVEYKGYPVWSRRWCSLNGYVLKYWFLPNEQDTCPPLGEINLKNCVSNEIKRADKDICINSTTLVLLMNVSDCGKKRQRKYFLSADNYVEFDKWLREFNIVLYYLRKWTQYSNYSRQ